MPSAARRGNYADAAARLTPLRAPPATRSPALAGTASVLESTAGRSLGEACSVTAVRARRYSCASSRPTRSTASLCACSLNPADAARRRTSASTGKHVRSTPGTPLGTITVTAFLSSASPQPQTTTPTYSPASAHTSRAAHVKHGVAERERRSTRRVLPGCDTPQSAVSYLGGGNLLLTGIYVLKIPHVRTATRRESVTCMGQ